METTQEDFADGTYERNIYASHYYGGALEFAPRFDWNNDGYIDVFTADIGGPYIRMYWGSASGYSSNDTTLFPTNGAANCDGADLNGDGYTDFVVNHRATPKISIYWGTPTGPDPSFYFDFYTSTSYCDAVFISDLNKDGYLDIATTQHIMPNNAAIFWGSASGYNIDNRTDLPSQHGVNGIEVADFNWDNWPDILLVDYLGSAPGENRIYWGSSSGFSPSNYISLTGPNGNYGSSVADLNRDRYLDLIFTGWYDPRSYIYWGSATGYSSSNMQVLNPGYCLGGSAIADINEDNYLDIVYYRGGYGVHEQEIYWGSATGYSDNDTSWFGIPLELSSGTVADLNYDGNVDIICNALTPASYSYIFWGPTFSMITPLPINSEGASNHREVGNVYNRRYNEFYISSVFDAGDIVNWGTAEWNDSIPTGTSIAFRVRTGDTPAHDTTWSTWFLANNGDSIPDTLNSRYIQYMANLKYTNAAYLPCLYEVRISYDTLTGIYTHREQLPQVPIRISPNPFRTRTKISYVVDKPNSTVCIRVFDITGRCVRTLVDGQHEPGNYTIEWSGNDDENQALPEGIYYLIYKSGDGSKNLTTLKIVHIKK